MGKGGSGGQVAGYKYRLCMLLGISRGPVNEVVQINADDLPLWTSGGVVSNTTVQLDKPNLFGGDQKEGGIQGTLEFMFGAATQSTVGSDAEAYVGGRTEISTPGPFGAIQDAFDPPPVTDGPFAPISGLRGTLTAFFNGLICANSPYPKPWKFRLRRTTAGWFDNDPWYPEEAAVAMDDGSGDPIVAMNGTHILVECLTNPVWGRGLPRSKINLDGSFASAARTLCREGFGLCILWDKQQLLQDFMQIVINHIGGAMYEDRSTGLIELKLLRDDYDPEDLPIFDYTSGLLSIQDDTTTAPDNSHSEIIVKWVDPITGKDRQTRVQNLAGTQANQTVTSTTTEYLGCPTNAMAGRLAMRDMQTQGSGIKRYTLTMDRRARKINPGSVFRINVPDRGISNMVLRAGKVDEGAIGSQTFKIVAVQDVFALKDTTYLRTPPKTWQRPDKNAEPVSNYKIQEITYRDSVRILTVAELAAVPVDDGDMCIVAAAPTGLAHSYELVTAAAGETFASHGNFNWCPSARLNGGIGYYDTTCILKNANLLHDAVLPSIAWIDDEMVWCTAFDSATSTLTIGRGAVDTLPFTHADNAKIWFAEKAMAADGREYTTGEGTLTRLLTRTNGNILRIQDAPDIPWTIAGRQGLPYPPGDFRLGGTPFANVTTIIGDIVFTWTHRDRLTQADHVLVHGDGSTGPEAGVTYRTRIWHGATLIRTTTGLTGTTWTYDTSMQVSDGVTSHITVGLAAMRDGLVSFQEYQWTFFIADGGWGKKWGLRYG